MSFCDDFLSMLQVFFSFAANYFLLPQVTGIKLEVINYICCNFKCKFVCFLCTQLGVPSTEKVLAIITHNMQPTYRNVATITDGKNVLTCMLWVCWLARSGCFCTFSG